MGFRKNRHPAEQTPPDAVFGLGPGSYSVTEVPVVLPPPAPEPAVAETAEIPFVVVVEVQTPATLPQTSDPIAVMEVGNSETVRNALVMLEAGEDASTTYDQEEKADEAQAKPTENNNKKKVSGPVAKKKKK